MIEATCVVDKEYEQYSWPYTFITLPRIGDSVEGTNLKDSPAKITLQVLEVIHTSQWRTGAGATTSIQPYPKIKLRLGKDRKRWTSKI
jgi:hypothetical protein